MAENNCRCCRYNVIRLDLSRSTLRPKTTVGQPLRRVQYFSYVGVVTDFFYVCLRLASFLVVVIANFAINVAAVLHIIKSYDEIIYKVSRAHLPSL